VFTKSARRTLSFSVSFADDFERTYNPPTIAATSTVTAAATRRIFAGFFAGATVLTPGEDGTGVTRDEEVRADGSVALAAGDVSVTAGTAPELAATTARPLSVSRFRRCKSARMSAACW